MPKVWEGGPTPAGDGSHVPLAATAALVREPGELPIEYVPVDRAQVRQVLQHITRELEDLATRNGAQSDGTGYSRRAHVADLLPKPRRLSPRAERTHLRRQLGLDP